MSGKDLPSYIVMFGACICIILLVAARHPGPGRQKIKEILHGRVYWITDSDEIDSNKNASIPSKLRSEKLTKVEAIPKIVDVSHGTAPKLWDKKDNNKYDEVAAIMKALDDQGIDSFLMGGSALGAHRNHGWIVGDKDVDLIVMSTNTAEINHALKIAGYIFGRTTPLAGSFVLHSAGFGYHIDLWCQKKQDTNYMDLWLFEEVSDDEVQLIGYERGAHRWCKMQWKESCYPFPKSYLYPVKYVPFGPYLMASASEKYLESNNQYGKTWNTKCGGWSRGNVDCSRYYNSQTFVFWSQDKEGNRVATAKKGNKIQHQFVVKNGEFTPI